MQTSEVLNKAADLIEERGWIKGFGWPGDPDNTGPELCLEGGIMAALGVEFDNESYFGEFQSCPAYRAVMRHLGAALDGSHYLFSWNDRYNRTAAEVIEVLRATAVIEAAREQDRVPVEVSA